MLTTVELFDEADSMVNVKGLLTMTLLEKVEMRVTVTVDVTVFRNRGVESLPLHGGVVKRFSVPKTL